MDKTDFSFIISGKDAESAADEIKKIINDEFDFETQIFPETDRRHTEETHRLDPIAVGALIVAIPSAILAFIKLKDKMKKREKLDRTLEKIRTQIVKKKEVTVRIKYPDGMIKEISFVDSIDIIDNIQE